VNYDIGPQNYLTSNRRQFGIKSSLNTPQKKRFVHHQGQVIQQIISDNQRQLVNIHNQVLPKKPQSQQRKFVTGSDLDVFATKAAELGLRNQGQFTHLDSKESSDYCPPRPYEGTFRKIANEKSF